MGAVSDEGSGIIMPREPWTTSTKRPKIKESAIRSH